MANVLKSGETYSDIRGNIYEDAYMIVDRFTGRSIPSPSLTFWLCIYKDLDARIAGMEPVFSTMVFMPTSAIIEYLASPKPAASTEIPNEFVKKQIYKYLTETMPAIDGSIIWSDWESD